MSWFNQHGGTGPSTAIGGTIGSTRDQGIRESSEAAHTRVYSHLASDLEYIKIQPQLKGRTYIRYVLCHELGESTLIPNNEKDQDLTGELNPLGHAKLRT